MTLPAYATRRDVRDLGGIPRGLVSNDGRLAASALASTDAIELNEHGFDTDDEVQLRAAEGGTLCAPLVAGTTYYAIRLSASTFKVAATAGGYAIGLTTDGVSVVVSSPLPVDRLCAYYSRWIDLSLPAHAVPLVAPYPEIVVGLVAQLVSKALLNQDGKSSEIVNAAELAAKAQLERFAAGLPLREPTGTARSNLAVTNTLSTTADPRGWGSGSLP